MFHRILKLLIVRSNMSSFIYYFMLSKLILGFYFNISKSKFYNTIIRFYCVTFSGFVIAITVKGYFDQRENYNSNSFALTSQYIFQTTTCQFHNQKFFFKFYSTLKAIDSSEVSVKYNKSQVSKYLLLLIFLVYFSLFVYVFIKFGFNLLVIAHILCTITSYLENVKVTLIFDLLRQRNILLWKYAKKLEDHDLYAEEKLRILKKILFSHKNLMTNLKHNSKAVKPMVG